MPSVSSNKAKVVLVAPFWARPLHVGAQRIERMLRWLHDEGYETVLIHAAREDSFQTGRLGCEIAVRDPLRRYPGPNVSGASHHCMKANEAVPGIFKKAGKACLLPDLDILWSRRMAAHPLVLAHAAGAAVVISSSPPESAHIGSSRLADALGAKLVIDLRDGWLDEPLKPQLNRATLRWHIEARLEARVVRRANTVLVTSDTWKALLDERLPFARDKTVVLTNSCPVDPPKRLKMDFPAEPLRLVYTGQFTHSKLENSAGLLLSCLWRSREAMRMPTELAFYGSYNCQDLSEMASWREKFVSIGHTLQVCDPLPIAEMRQVLADAHGTLLLSATHAAIVAKLFDCLASGRPVLVVTYRGSGTWKAAFNAPAAALMDLSDDTGNVGVLDRFYEKCSVSELLLNPPEEYSDDRAKSIFLSVLEELRGTEKK